MDDNNDLIKEINDLNETAVRLFETYDDRFKELEVEAIGIVSRLTDITDKNIDLINKAKEGMIEELQGITDDIINARDAAVNDIINLRNASEASITKLRDESIAEINAKTDSILEKIADAEKYISDLIANAKTDIDKKVSDAKNDIDVLTEAFRTLGENITAEFIDLKDSAIQSLEVKRLQSIDDLNAEYIKDRDLLNDLTNTSKDDISKATTDGVNELRSVGTEEKDKVTAEGTKYLDDLDKKVNDGVVILETTVTEGNTELTGTKNDGKDEIVVAKDLAIEEINAIERGNAINGTWLGNGYAYSQHFLQDVLAPLLTFRPTFAGNFEEGMSSKVKHSISFDAESDTLAYLPNDRGVIVVTNAMKGGGMYRPEDYHWIAETGFEKVTDVFIVKGGKQLCIGGETYFPEDTSSVHPGIVVYDIENLTTPDTSPYPINVYDDKLVLYVSPLSTGSYYDYFSTTARGSIGFASLVVPSKEFYYTLGDNATVKYQAVGTNALNHKEQSIIRLSENSLSLGLGKYPFSLEKTWDYRFSITLNLTDFKKWMDSQPDPANHPRCDVGTFMVENGNGDLMGVRLRMEKGKLKFYCIIINTINGVSSYFTSLTSDDGMVVSDITYVDRGGDLELNGVIWNKCLCLQSRGNTLPVQTFPADAGLANMDISPGTSGATLTFGRVLGSFNSDGTGTGVVSSYTTAYQYLNEEAVEYTVINFKNLLLSNTDLTTSIKITGSNMWFSNFNSDGVVKGEMRRISGVSGTTTNGLVESVCESFNENELVMLSGDDNKWTVKVIDSITLEDKFTFEVDLGIPTKTASGVFYKIESLERSFTEGTYLVVLTGLWSSEDKVVHANFSTEKKTANLLWGPRNLDGWSGYFRNFIGDGTVMRATLLSKGKVRKWETCDDDDGFGGHYSEIYAEATGVGDYLKNISKERYGSMCYGIPYRYMFMVDRYGRLKASRTMEVY